GAVVALRDPEVERLRVENLKLIVKAENLYHELEEHNEQLAVFLERAYRYTEGEEGHANPSG
ncbi:MAG: hypothetical protein ABIQ39_16120, partial [Ilumatobacteraceae bacterium]